MPRNELYHPRPRQPSTSSTLFTSSVSGGSSIYKPGTRASTSTSWSDHSDDAATEMKDDGTATVVGDVRWTDDVPLIDLDGIEEQNFGDGVDGSSFESHEGQFVQDGKLVDDDDEDEVEFGNAGIPEPTPGEKLRMLLKQMEVEVRETTNQPIKRPISAPGPLDAGNGNSGRIPKSNWREGRRIGALPKERDFSPPRSPPMRFHGDIRPEQYKEMKNTADEEEDSPPTPPPRITNPYLYSSRRISDEHKASSTAPRISSRAAVLHASTSLSPPPEPEHQLTPLETYIANGPSRPVPRTTPPPTSPSRKGKERAQPSLSPAANVSSKRPTRLPARTPRKWSVELAPQKFEDFAQEAHHLEQHREAELDLEESIGEVPWMVGGESLTDMSENSQEMKQQRRDERLAHSLSPNRSHRSNHQNRLDIDLNDHSTRMFRSPSRTIRQQAQDESLPALPEPETSFADDENEVDALSSRRAALFRASSRSRSSRLSTSPFTAREDVTNEVEVDLDEPESSISALRRTRSVKDHYTSQSTAKISLSTERSPIPEKHVPISQPVYPQEPMHVGMAFAPSPARGLQSNVVYTPNRAGDTTLGQTPKPPGAWMSGKKPSSVRFSPLRQEVAFDSESQEDSGNTSIHRIKLSPRKSPMKSSPSKTRSFNESEEGDNSFTGRLKSLSRSLSKSITPSKSIPKPSTTLVEAKDALSKAAEATALAQARVEKTQKAWLEALALAGQGVGTGVQVVKSGVGWGSWLWWISMEILLVWGVFRVTLDYAAVSTYNPFDPFAPPRTHALATRLPSAISAFVIPPANRRGSANFFDILERLEIWRFVEDSHYWMGEINGGRSRVAQGWVPT